MSDVVVVVIVYFKTQTYSFLYLQIEPIDLLLYFIVQLLMYLPVMFLSII